MRFWREQVAPHVDGDRVRWVGTVTGRDRDDLRRERPGRAVPAALGGAGRHARWSSRSPWARRWSATARGCLPELIEHGRTGLLTADEEELGDLVLAAEPIDPAECRAGGRAAASPRR